ncbi:MAG: DUF3179 domain-containing protein [Actinomycetota bacterium]
MSTPRRAPRSASIARPASSARARRRSAGLLLVGVLAIAACGSDDDATDDVAAASATTADDTDGSTSSATDSSATESASSTGGATPVSLDGGAMSPDPADLPDPASFSGDRSSQVESATESWPTDWDRRTVGLDEFLVGIPTSDPRDVIRPIDEPVYEPIAAADWLDEREPGALVRFEGETRFYPLSIMTRHEIVNDVFGDVPVVVTYCPLCNTAVTFDRRVDGDVLRFGVSGLLRNSDLVMWDDATTSLWQQISGEGIVGDFDGTLLEIIPTSIVSYGEVLENFPEAESLSRDLGFGIDYGLNPYTAYSSSTQPFLFDGEPDPRFPALSRVVGVTIRDGDTDGDVHQAYPFDLIDDVRVVNDEVDGVPIVVFWGGDTADALDTASIAEGQAVGTGLAFDRRVGDQVLTFESAGDDTFVDTETQTTWSLLGVGTDGPLAGEQLETVPHRNEFWFAWSAFFPDADVWSP